MTLRLRLTGKVLLCAIVNLALLVTVAVIFIRLQFRTGLESALLAPVQSEQQRTPTEGATKSLRTVPSNRQSIDAP